MIWMHIAMSSLMGLALRPQLPFLDVKSGAIIHNTSDCGSLFLCTRTDIRHILYRSGYLGVWEIFSSDIQPFTAYSPFMIIDGNHERDWAQSSAMPMLSCSSSFSCLHEAEMLCTHRHCLSHLPHVICCSGLRCRMPSRNLLLHGVGSKKAGLDSECMQVVIGATLGGGNAGCRWRFLKQETRAGLKMHALHHRRNI